MTTKRSQWPEVTLGDHVDLLSGFAFKSKQFTDDPQDIPLVKGANVHQGFIDWETAKRWPSTNVNKLEKYFFAPNDVVLAMDRPWIEAGLKWAWIRPEHPKALLVQRVSRMRGLCDLDTRFLRYIVGSPQFTDYIRPIVTGVNVPHISGSQIKGFTFRLPPLPTQHKIASILSAYDDLIENNTRRIAILEEMAQAIHREWFVNFRFPGHENVKLVDSPLGKIPEGWEATTLGAVSENFDRLRKPLSKMQRADMKGPYPYYGAARVFDYIDDYIFDGKYLLTAEDGSVITPDRKPVLQLAYDKFWVNNHTHVLRGIAPVSTDYLFLALSDTDVSPYVTGAAQPKINQRNLNSIPMRVGNEAVMQRFDKMVDPCIGGMRTLKRKNECLRTTRDLLLPKLISGKLDVEDHDIDVGDLDEEVEEATA